MRREDRTGKNGPSPISKQAQAAGAGRVVIFSHRGGAGLPPATPQTRHAVARTDYESQAALRRRQRRRGTRGRP